MQFNFKKILVVLAVIFMGVFFAQVVSAQQTETDAQSDLQVSDQNSPQVYVTKVDTDKVDYKVGDSIKVSVDLYNGSNFAVGSFYPNILIGSDFDEAGNPGIIFEEKTSEKVSIGPKERKKINIVYKIPSQVDGSDVKFQVTATLPSGLRMGSNESSAFKVVGGKKILYASNAYMEVIDKKDGVFPQTFSLRAGVPIDKNNKVDAQLTVDFENKTGEALVLKPVLQIFNRTSEQGEKVYGKTLDPVSFSSSGSKTKSFKIMVPHLNYKPGTYEGVLKFIDESNSVRSEPISFRYVVRGEMAMIHSVVSDTNAVNSGQEYSVKIDITGEPEDTFFEDKATKHNATIKLLSKNENGETVAETSKLIKLTAYLSQVVIPVKALKTAQSQYLKVEVWGENNQLLTTYDEPLGSVSNEVASTTVNSVPQNESWLSVVWNARVALVLFLLVLLIGVGVFKLRTVTMLLFFVLFFSSFLAHSIAFAYWEDSGKIYWNDGNHKIPPQDLIHTFFDSPFENEVVNPVVTGNQKKVTITVRGHTDHYACLNEDTDTKVQMFDGVKKSSPVVAFGSNNGNGRHIGSWRTKNYSYKFEYLNDSSKAIGSVLISKPKVYNVDIPYGQNTARITFYVRRYWTSNKTGQHDMEKAYRSAFQPYIISDPSQGTTTPTCENNTPVVSTTTANVTCADNSSGTSTIVTVDICGSNVSTVSKTSCTVNKTGECTPGVDCPDLSLGRIIQSAAVRPNYASSKNDKCPFFWVIGTETASSTISCKLITNGIETLLPKVQPDPINGMSVSVGSSVLSCSRGSGAAQAIETQEFVCHANPQIKEI